MESSRTKMKVQIGEFPVIDVKSNAIRISLGQGVNCWIHMNFEHGAQPSDYITLYAEVPYALSRPAPIEPTS